MTSEPARRSRQSTREHRRAYEAFSRGDITAVFGILGPDITWHVPGSSPLSGDYKGHDQVGAFFAATMELSGGTFTIDVHNILAQQDQVVVLCTVAAERLGQSWSSPEVHVWRVAGTQAVDFCEFQGDQENRRQILEFSRTTMTARAASAAPVGPEVKAR
jgi:ketosteroid isomerase-like protein